MKINLKILYHKLIILRVDKNQIKKSLQKKRGSSAKTYFLAPEMSTNGNYCSKHSNANKYVNYHINLH